MKEDNKKNIDELTQAIRLGFDNAIFYYSRGSAYFANEDYENAVKDFDQAIMLDPDNNEYIAALLISLLGKHKHDKALEDCTKGIAVE